VCRTSYRLLDHWTEDPLVPKVPCTARCPNGSAHDGNAKGKSKNTQRKNTDGPPRPVQMLGAISDRRSAHAGITGRYARHLLRGRMRVVLASMVAMRNRSGREIVVIVVVILVVLRIERTVVGTRVVATGRGVLSMLGVVRVVLRLLAGLLALAALHPRLLEQTTLLGEPLALLSVLPLVLADQRHGLVAKDVLELAELADPGILGRVVEVCILLLDAALVGSVLVQLPRAALGLRGRRGLLLLWLGALLRRGVPAGGGGVRAVHPGARLRALGGHHGRVWADRRAGAGGLGVRRCRCVRGGIRARWLWVRAFLLARPHHLVCRVGAAREGELRLVGGVLGGFLLQQAHVFVAVGWRGCLRVGNGGRDDAALLGWT
jgi:hypothetical protein